MRACGVARLADGTTIGFASRLAFIAFSLQRMCEMYKDTP
jgi:hypothetical protein